MSRLSSSSAHEPSGMTPLLSRCLARERETMDRPVSVSIIVLPCMCHPREVERKNPLLFYFFLVPQGRFAERPSQYTKKSGLNYFSPCIIMQKNLHKMRQVDHCGTFASSELNALSAVLGIVTNLRLSHDSRQDSTPPSLDLYPLDPPGCIWLFSCIRGPSSTPGKSLSSRSSQASPLDHVQDI